MPTVPHSTTVTIKRLTATEGTAGGLTYAYSTGARGSLPTTCSNVVPAILSLQERMEYGIRGHRTVWRFFSYWTRPQVDTRDLIEWTVTHSDGGTTTYQAKVITGETNVYSDVGIYQWFGEDNTAED